MYYGSCRIIKYYMEHLQKKNKKTIIDGMAIE